MSQIAIKNNFKLITTEKDFYRIRNYDSKKLGYLKVDLEIGEKNKFINEIMNNI